MSNHVNTIFLKQLEDKTLYVTDLRKLSYLMEHLEGLNKFLLVNLELDQEYKNLNLKQKQKRYRLKDRLQISKVAKQSPIEIEVIVNSLQFTIELFLVINDFFEGYELELRMKFEKLINRPLTSDEWKSLLYRYKQVKKFLQFLKITLLVVR
jgi:hypothetical protein